MTSQIPVRVFLGHDRRVPIVSQVATHSIESRSSLPVSVTKLHISTLQEAGLMTRPLQGNQSTEFSFSRFLVPCLAGFEGWAIFMDNDVVVQADIAELWALRDERYAVMCVKHDHNPKENTKFLGEAQTRYEKKNWSSVMMFNSARCKALTPDYVNSASGLDLHRFHWLEGDHLIGELPAGWNFLVDYSTGDPLHQELLHYTDGGPYYKSHLDCQAADIWIAERDRMLMADERPLSAVFPEEFA